MEEVSHRNTINREHVTSLVSCVHFKGQIELSIKWLCTPIHYTEAMLLPCTVLFGNTPHYDGFMSHNVKCLYHCTNCWVPPILFQAETYFHDVWYEDNIRERLAIVTSPGLRHSLYPGGALAGCLLWWILLVAEVLQLIRCHLWLSWQPYFLG